MLYSGLVSVTFRGLEPEAIVKLAAEASLDGIEWGGDVHVPHGDMKKAAVVGRMTRMQGLRVASYGSYYHAGCEGESLELFRQTVKTAVALGAPAIRLWAGIQGSAETGEETYCEIVESVGRMAEIAETEGMHLNFEYHSGTLTDSTASAIRLLSDIGKPNVGCYWQPPVGMDKQSCLKGLDNLMPWLSNLHVFQWITHDRCPLSEGAESWESYLEKAAELPGDRYCMLEFVKDDSIEQFQQDAAVLRTWLKQQNGIK